MTMSVGIEMKSRLQRVESGELMSKREITTIEMIVGPEQAKQWLENNSKNRPISNLVVRKYTEEMKIGAWEFTAQGITISADDGSVIDGQHRLLAIVASGTSQRMLVHLMTGHSGGVGIAYDCGRKRGADIVAGEPKQFMELANRLVGEASVPQYKMTTRAASRLCQFFRSGEQCPRQLREFAQAGRAGTPVFGSTLVKAGAVLAIWENRDNTSAVTAILREYKALSLGKSEEFTRPRTHSLYRQLLNKRMSKIETIVIAASGLSGEAPTVSASNSVPKWKSVLADLLEVAEVFE